MASYDATGYLPRILEKFSARYGGNVVGAVLVVLSSFTLAAMLAAAKDLSASYSVWQIVLIRSLGVGFMLTPVILRSRGSVLISNRFSLQVLRVCLGFIVIISMFHAVAHLPLAVASAISFSRAIFVVGLAAVIFGEKVGVIGWFAAAIGLAGVTVMLDPTADALNDAALIAAVGAFTNACVVMVIKKLTTTDATVTIMCYPAIGLTLLCIIPSILTWQPITWDAAPVFGVLMIASILSNWCFINSYRHGEASIMGTIEYFRLVAAALFGFIIFDEIPTLDALAGISLIIAASFIAVRRDQIRARLMR
jgi:drug/metabolite transporter (DMT)-like permease